MKNIIFKILAVLFYFVPRDKHLWLTGKVAPWEYKNSPPMFFDNSKYFYLYLVKNTNEKVYWITSSKTEKKMLEEMGLPVKNFYSFTGIYLTLRAKYFFHHYGINQIDTILQKGSIQLDFWHGTPLKKIRYDVQKKPAITKKHLLDYLDKNGIEYVSSTSRYLSDHILRNAFLVENNQLLDFGYPRTDIFKLSIEENYEFCKRYSQNLLPFIDKTKKHKYTCIYMPTFRDDDHEYFEKALIDYDLLNNKLLLIDCVMFIKLHPLTSCPPLDNYSNIFQIPNDVDVYPFMIYTDFLITDYSSIFFDYLLLNKEIIFIPYDYNNYVKNREIYFDYETITPGKKYYDFESFINDLENINTLDFSKERQRVYSLLYDNYKYDACENIYDFIKKKYIE